MKYFTRVSVCLSIVIAMMLTMSANAFAAGTVSTSSTGVQSALTDTQFDLIKQACDGSYYIQTEGTDFIQPVGRLDIELTNGNEVEQFMQLETASDEVKQYISELAGLAEEQSLSSLKVSYFAPELLNARTTIYNTYRGIEMRSEFVSVVNISTGYTFQYNGTGAKNIAAAVSQVILYVGGIRSKVVSLGGTLLSIFEALAGPVVIASAEDFTQVALNYTSTKQWTYGKLDGINWRLGYCSQCVTVNYADTYQQFVVNGVGSQEYSRITLRENVKASNYSNPWETAYNNLLNPLTELISYSYRGTIYYFG